MIKNVIFDIGKVLTAFEWLKFMEEMFDDAAVREKITKAVWESGWWKELDRGVIPEEEVLMHLREEAGEYVESMNYAFDHLDKCFLRTEYSANWVKELKALGYNVYFLSNYSKFVMRQAPDSRDFLEFMDGGVFSCDVGLIKPDPAIYKALIDKYGLDPEECIFTDDVQANIDVARELGFRAIRFDGYEKTYPVIMNYLKSEDNGKQLTDLPGEGLAYDGMNWNVWNEK
jgi:putative hydrolase of the HAD superfamily